LLRETPCSGKPIASDIFDRSRREKTGIPLTNIGKYLDNVTLEKANLSMAYMENALVGPDSHEDGSFAPAVTLEGHGCPKPSMSM